MRATAHGRTSFITIKVTGAGDSWRWKINGAAGFSRLEVESGSHVSEEAAAAEVRSIVTRVVAGATEIILELMGAEPTAGEAGGMSPS